MLENWFRGRVQEGLYITDGFSSSKLFTITTYLGKQAMQEISFSGRVHEGLYINDGFSSPKLFTLSTYLG